MGKVKIYHNPRCTKSRQTLKLLEEKEDQSNIEVIKYLETPPSEDELRDILDKLGLTAAELVRKGEQVWKDDFRDRSLSEDELIKIMVENPKLIERPVVVKDGKAVLGRPPENVMLIL